MAKQVEEGWRRLILVVVCCCCVVVVKCVLATLLVEKLISGQEVAGKLPIRPDPKKGRFFWTDFLVEIFLHKTREAWVRSHTSCVNFFSADACTFGIFTQVSMVTQVSTVTQVSHI